MDLGQFDRIGPYQWQIPQSGGMRVPAQIFADETLLRDMDDKVGEQIRNVACLPGIVTAAYAMPDAHWGYGFPIGGVAAFDPEQGGVVSAGGVGFDISCGVRLHVTNLAAADIRAVQDKLAHELSRAIPAGMGSRGSIRLNDAEMADMLAGGAAWAVAQGYGRTADLARIEEQGKMAGATPEAVSAKAINRQREEMGTLGSGNHYLEVQRVDQLFDDAAARAYGLAPDQAVVMIHCGSRGLGHQIGTEYLREMAIAAPGHGIDLPDRELACAPITSELGQRYLGVMRAAINCAFANRQILTHLVRGVFDRFFDAATLDLLYDVSHNTCKEERHAVDGVSRRLFVHRKGATRAYGPNAAGLPEALSATGQPVLIGGSMGTESWVLAGDARSEAAALSSACHGAGRAMSRHQAAKLWTGSGVTSELAALGITVKSPSKRGIAEEAPGAYKSVARVVEVAEQAGLARRVARLKPMICIKG
ncbi:RtcB family protein [Marimonas arenosa]|uniref:tRNA-splicing ligase RtcB n=1 Tax=Marimonas arenosa TaxID=1795305 RepID=A0AAE3WB14_9RHOB|nr:RtcB family protein [Marimonas arenosa]MDQ2089896.1 RtcB family protein [Marimonas arenosa]